MRPARLRHQIMDIVILICLACSFLKVSMDLNEQNLPGVIWADTEGYYMYLPAVFIQKSLHHVPERSMNCRFNDKGERVMKYTCGLSFFYLPFFIGSHLYARHYHYDTSGFSVPYYYGMMVCGVFWAFIGLYVLRKLLLRYFSRSAMWLTLVCIMVGTNFFFYSVRFMGMSHIYNFALMAILLLLTDNYISRPRQMTAIYTALVLGWLVLIRPTNCIAVLCCLLFMVNSRVAFRERLGLVRANWRQLAIAVPFFIVPLIPQLLYWKEMTGHFVNYSYKGEGFPYWWHPKVVAVLFDTQNGWLLYTPIMLCMFIGMLWARHDRRTNLWLVSLLFVLMTYIFSSWSTWWFGAAYGHRCYIDYYPLFAFPFAMFMERLLRTRWYVYIPVFLVIILLIYCNIGLSILFGDTGFWDGPDWRWAWARWWDLVLMAFK